MPKRDNRLGESLKEQASTLPHFTSIVLTQETIPYASEGPCNWNSEKRLVFVPLADSTEIYMHYTHIGGAGLAQW